MHYLDLITINKMDFLKLIRTINHRERQTFQKSVESTHSIFKHTNDLCIDEDELGDMENEVFHKVLANPKDVCSVTSGESEAERCPGVEMSQAGLSYENTVYQNPYQVCGLEDAFVVTSDLEEHAICKFVVLSVLGQEVTSGVDLATCDNEQNFTWFKGGQFEEILAVLLSCMSGIGDLGRQLKSNCTVIGRYMTVLKTDIEAKYRSTMSKGMHQVWLLTHLTVFPFLLVKIKKHTNDHCLTSQCSVSRARPNSNR